MAVHAVANKNSRYFCLSLISSVGKSHKMKCIADKNSNNSRFARKIQKWSENGGIAHIKQAL